MPVAVRQRIRLLDADLFVVVASALVALGDRRTLAVPVRDADLTSNQRLAAEHHDTTIP
jgi:hypothetical protein